MSDTLRAPRCWDLVLIACGKAKRPTPCRAHDMYTGPVFAAHMAIALHLDEWPFILSAKHGMIGPGTMIEPYETRIEDAAPTWNDLVARSILRHLAASTIPLLRYVESPALTLPFAKGERMRELNAEPSSFAFGPPRQPSVLVLAGAKYIDGWIDRVRAGGVRVDDPLRGYEIGERRTFARRFVAETVAWGPGEDPDERGWTRHEQLLSFVDSFDFDRAGGFVEADDALAAAEAPRQLGLDIQVTRGLPALAVRRPRTRHVVTTQMELIGGTL